MSDDELPSWTSKLVQFLTDTRTLHAIIGVIVAGSIAAVLRADIDTALQFLSFLVLFVVVAVIFFPYTKPLRE